MDFAALVEATDISEFSGLPLPGWGGPALLFGTTPGGEGEKQYIAAGVPFDGTASSRPGSAEGPNAIRRASTVFSSYLNSLGEHEMLDLRNGETFRYRSVAVGDVGDLHVFQTDTLRTFRAVAAETAELARYPAKLLLLGGDHSISFPTFCGWQKAMRDHHGIEDVGYVQVDHHFDFGDTSVLHGPLYHGSNSRRISELPGMSLDRMAFVGVGAVTRLDQFRHLRNAGAQIVTRNEIRKEGTGALEAALDHLGHRCSAIYLSIDIDVLDAAYAPGTGHVTVGGLDTGELFDVVAALHSLNVRAMDIVEVSPRYDPTGRTAQIAANLLFETVSHA
ncbi:agmatinase family protein [Labrenzia sp. OB1]|uniref:agmatinase family protein n=1 Tax=Labrenzia sp. OB1 TaxID=1561204 RepID=UPI0007B2D3E4|nr:agmatinase family protein [Labrenzia sp. OB1]KZM50319.1 hypothetical protein OA90_10475 [Labrenzia sp. OB1]